VFGLAVTLKIDYYYYYYYYYYQIWHTHVLAPNSLFQVDLLVVITIISSCLSLKHLMTYLNPYAWSCYIYLGFIEVNYKLAWLLFTGRGLLIQIGMLPVASRRWPKVKGKVYRGDSVALSILKPQLAPVLGLFTRVLV
jgi:hypothetical protein